MAMRKGGGGVVMVVVMVVVVVLGGCVAPATPTSPPTPPPHPPPLPLSTTAGVMTEAPPPTPSQLRMRPKDCPLYVLGELRGIKKHGETWLNDGNACELCKCVEGLKRCYYHYCNQLTEVVTNPPSGRPPLDDEDGGEGEGDEEGSGRPPPRAKHYGGDHLKNYRTSIPHEIRVHAEDNDTRLPAFCGPYCYKPCPWGYKMDPVRQCRQCSCRRRCHDLDKCQLRCPEGLATDSHGCPVCQCRGEGQVGRRPDPGCNDTKSAEEGIHEVSVGRAEVTVQSAWEGQLTYAQPRTPTPPHEAGSDGAVKSAVQADVVVWWQMALIMIPLAVVGVVGVACALKFWRRAHHDKYDINSYRMPRPLGEKVRPVTTAADHVRGRMM